MTKLVSLAALLFLAIGCGAPPSASETGESEEALSVNGRCSEQYRSCIANCEGDATCDCLCHNELANCTVPRGRLMFCP
jgi:hypothetical protein